MAPLCLQVKSMPEQHELTIHLSKIPGFRESVSGNILSKTSSELSQHCRIQCVEHSRAIAEILQTLLEFNHDTSMKDASLAALAIPAFQSATILARSVHMPGTAEPFDVRLAVTACKTSLQIHDAS